MSLSFISILLVANPVFIHIVLINKALSRPSFLLWRRSRRTGYARSPFFNVRPNGQPRCHSKHTASTTRYSARFNPRSGSRHVSTRHINDSRSSPVASKSDVQTRWPVAALTHQAAMDGQPPPTRQSLPNRPASSPANAKMASRPSIIKCLLLLSEFEQAIRCLLALR